MPKAVKQQQHKEEDFDAILANEQVEIAASNHPNTAYLFAVALAVSSVSSYFFYGLRSMRAQQDLLVLAVLAAVTSYLLFDAAVNAATARLVANRSRKGGDAVAEATWSTAWQNNLAYFTIFGTLGWYVMPNLAANIEFLASYPAISAFVSMLVPAGLLAAHFRKLL